MSANSSEWITKENVDNTIKINVNKTMKYEEFSKTLLFPDSVNTIQCKKDLLYLSDILTQAINQKEQSVEINLNLFKSEKNIEDICYTLENYYGGYQFTPELVREKSLLNCLCCTSIITKKLFVFIS